MNKFVVLVAFACCTVQMHAQTWSLAWSEEFNGTVPDSATWTMEVNDNGGFNNELQYYTDRPENIRLEDGNLVIEARRENWLTRDYTSARIHSNGKFSWKYGRIEARMKLPYGAGMWPAFWMLSEPDGGSQRVEADIMELIGGNSCEACGDNQVYGAIHWNEETVKKSISAGEALDSGIYHDRFYRFALEWDSDHMSWYVDDSLLQTVSLADVSPGVFDHSFYLLLNLAVGGDWPGPPDGDTEWPQLLLVDYIRIYKRSPAVSE